MTAARPKDIAVLMTCFNRRETTLGCLHALADQAIPVGYSLRVLLTDDGSSDGTGEAVRREFPGVTVLQGDGDLYWVGGTLAAWEAARPADFYLWLNDDVRLRPGALRTLIEVHVQSGHPAAIAVGATCDPERGKTCTGGMRRMSWFNVRVMDPTDAVQMCDSINGNIVLVPRAAEERRALSGDAVASRLEGAAPPFQWLSRATAASPPLSPSFRPSRITLRYEAASVGRWLTLARAVRISCAAAPSAVRRASTRYFQFSPSGCWARLMATGSRESGSSR